MPPREFLAKQAGLSAAEEKASAQIHVLPMQDPSVAAARLAALRASIELEDEPRVSSHPFVHPSSALRSFLPTDILGLVLGFVVAWGLAAVVNAVFFDRILPGAMEDGGARLSRLGLIVVCALMWFEHTGHYKLRMPFWHEAQKIAATFFAAMLVDGFMQFTAKEDFSRFWLVGGWIFAALAVVGGRNLARYAMRRARSWQVRTLLISKGDMADEARRVLRVEPALGYEVCAQIENLPMALLRDGFSWRRLCERFGASYVLIALDGKDFVEISDEMNQLLRENVPFSVLPSAEQLPLLGMAVQPFYNHDTLLLSRFSGLEQPFPRFLKRFFDIVVASFSLAVLSPLFLILALLVRRDGGKAFFGHERLGRDGKMFRCLKFRSMVPDADKALEEHLAANSNARAEWKRDRKLKADPRVTALGAFMRRTSLDELPQLFNVLRGDMSLVGPRPIVYAEARKYAADAVHYYRVRPGITGLWQVSGRNDVSYERRVQLDIWYVRNWSLWRDMAILCKTVPVLLKRTGAY
jgi:Undecaprenyl-phosphate galactose phosphotransferase WbaP